MSLRHLETSQVKRKQEQMKACSLACLLIDIWTSLLSVQAYEIVSPIVGWVVTHQLKSLRSLPTDMITHQLNVDNLSLRLGDFKF